MGLMRLWQRRTSYLFVVVVLAVLGRQTLGLKEGQRERADQKRKRSASVPLNRLPTTLEHLVAGTIGGMSGVLLSYPLDTVRIRMQTSSKILGPARTASIVLQEAGVAGFYRGVLSPVLGAALIKSAVFGGYGLFQSAIRRATGRDDVELNLLHLGVAAMGSGLVGSFVVTPVERIKVVMQAAVASAYSSPVGLGMPRGGAGYTNAWGCARGLVAEHGVRRGLYAGLGPTLLREVPGYACYFATYEACKRILLRGAEGEDGGGSRGSSLFKTALSGGLAGIAAWLPVYPVDVVKSRMQSAGGTGGGMVETASLMWRTEGFAPFRRGLAPTLARATVNHAATFLVYEAAMEWMRGRSKLNDAGEVEGDVDLMVA